MDPSLPDLHPPPYGDIRDPSRPILSFGWQADGPHRAAAHAHPRGHIIFVERGVYWAATPEGHWLVPTGQAIWIPPAIPHEIYSHGPVTARVLFVDADHAVGLPVRSCTVTISRLLAELVLRASDYGNDYPPDGAAARLARVMLDELASLAPAPLLLPAAKDPRLTRAIAQLLKTPSAQTRLEDVASEAGASARTLARLFRGETAMSFAQWKTRLVLVLSIERLAQGASVTDAALDFGYGSTSSFVYMFRKNLGVSPGRFSSAAVDPLPAESADRSV